MKRRAATRRNPTRLAEYVCREAVMPQPFTAEAYQTVLGNAVGRPVRLVPLPAVMPDTVSSLTGMTVHVNGTHYVFYRIDTSLVHQLHVIHHELFHVLEGHPGTPVTDKAVKDALATLLRPDLPHLRSDLIRHLVGRSCAIGDTGDRHERDAERFAVAMAERLGLTAWPAAQTQDTESGKLGRLLSDGRQ